MPLSLGDLKTLQLILNLSEDTSNGVNIYGQAIESTFKDKDEKIDTMQYTLNLGEEKDSLEEGSTCTEEEIQLEVASCDSSVKTDTESDTEIDFESHETYDVQSDVLLKQNKNNEEAHFVVNEMRVGSIDYAGVFQDVKSEILSFLNQRDVAKTCRVCKEWRQNNEYIQCIQSSNTIGLDVLKENISKVPRLLSLDLWCLWLGDAGSRELANLLREHRLFDLKRIKIFIMSSDIRASGTKYLLEELRKGVCPNLHMLDLNQNSFGDNEVQLLGEVLKSIENEVQYNENKEKRLKERSNRLSRSYSESDTHVFAETQFLPFLYEGKHTKPDREMRRASFGFETLNLRHNRISEEGLLKFMNHFMDHKIPVLRSIDLCKNKVDKDAVTRLSEKFPLIHFKV